MYITINTEKYSSAPGQFLFNTHYFGDIEKHIPLELIYQAFDVSRVYDSVPSNGSEFCIQNNKLILRDLKFTFPIPIPKTEAAKIEFETQYAIFGHQLTTEENQYTGYENINLLVSNFEDTLFYSFLDEEIESPIKGYFGKRKVKAFTIRSDNNGTVSITDYSDFFTWKAIFYKPKMEDGGPVNYNFSYFWNLCT